MNAEQREIDSWIKTDDYRKSSDIETLNAPKENRQYLENRLWKTFKLGMEAGRKIQKEETIKAFLKLMENTK